MWKQEHDSQLKTSFSPQFSILSVSNIWLADKARFLLIPKKMYWLTGENNNNNNNDI